MLRAEARWFARVLADEPVSALSPLLSIGSGDARFRAQRQPWIDQIVFDPLAERGVQVLHHELEARAGIDIAGDLTDQGFIRDLRSLGISSILCNSVLEHLEDRRPLLGGLAAALDVGGSLLISVPHRFPFHPDPIDTMFRPTPDELTGELRGFETVDAELVATESLARYWLGSRARVESIRNGLRSVGSRRTATTTASSNPKPDGQGTRLREIGRMALLGTSVSCVHARRTNEPTDCT